MNPSLLVQGQPTERGSDMTTDHIDSNTACPHWCIADHSLFQGEDAHVHIGIDEHLTDEITTRLVASRNPHTGTMDGPTCSLTLYTSPWTPTNSTSTKHETSARHSSN